MTFGQTGLFVFFICFCFWKLGEKKDIFGTGSGA